MITIVDCKQSYMEACFRNYKQVSLQSVIDEISNRTVHTEKSRYEVLRENDRRIYFDIEGIPEDKPDMISDIVGNLDAYMKSIGLIDHDLKYALTYNAGSLTHKGHSYHLILPEYKMNFNINRNLVIAFTHSDFGKEYIDYIDGVVYTNHRLFKLPYYIGMCKSGIDTNPDNHHRIIVGDVSDCIIQDTRSAKYLTYDFNIPSEWHKAVKRISPKFQQQLNKTIRDTILKNLPKDDKPETLIEKKIKYLKYKLDTILANKDKVNKIEYKCAERMQRVGVSKDTLKMYEACIIVIYDKLKPKLSNDASEGSSGDPSEESSETTS